MEKTRGAEAKARSLSGQLAINRSRRQKAPHFSSLFCFSSVPVFSLR
jgi:hypothetical protein